MSGLTLVPNCGEPESLDAVTERFLAMNSEIAAKYARYTELFESIGTDTQKTAEKRLANLRARCALQGVQLHVIDGDNGLPLYIVTKWALTASLDSLDNLAAWVSRVDGQSE